MNCASTKPTLQRRGTSGARGGYTFIELLIALAIAAAFLGGAYTAFIHILEAHSRSAARLEALRNARTAISTISDEFKAIDRLGADFLLIGLDQTLPYGDGYDNDGNGIVDDKAVDGQPLASAWTTADDRHALIGTTYERPLYAGRPDLGDAAVDADVKFGRDSIVLRIFPKVPTPDLTLKTVTYDVESYDGQPNVLVRRARLERTSGPPLDSIAPLAFDVLGFDLLYWDPNNTPDQQYWVTTWDSSNVANFNPPNLPLPASIYLRLTMNCDVRPHDSIQPGKPVDTVILETIVDIEQTIGDALYPRATF